MLGKESLYRNQVHELLDKVLEKATGQVYSSYTQSTLFQHNTTLQQSKSIHTCFCLKVSKSIKDWSWCSASASKSSWSMHKSNICKWNECTIKEKTLGDIVHYIHSLLYHMNTYEWEKNLCAIQEKKWQLRSRPSRPLTEKNSETTFWPLGEEDWHFGSKKTKFLGALNWSLYLKWMAPANSRIRFRLCGCVQTTTSM